MSSIPEALACLEAAVHTVAGLDWASLPIGDRLQALERVETVRRRTSAVGLDVIGSIERSRDPALGGAAAKVIADVVRVSPTEARRRIRDAGQLQPRTSLTGQCLPPALPGTAEAWNAGLLDIDHLRTIQKFVAELPEDVHPDAATKAERFLADKAAELRPDQLARLADRLAATLNPDGRFSDEYRAAQRGFQWCGRQRLDGMSIGRLVATPELRAMFEAWFAKFAAPGMCNPADQSPTVTGEPTTQAEDRDTRSLAQRQHDAVVALVRSQLGNPVLGTHRGLPVTVIVSTTLEQLRTGAGVAHTGGGSLLPVSDLIRMASHAWHYLCVFDDHSERPLYLGRTKRIATVDQRIVLHAKDRGCTAPGCDMPGYQCEAHHCDEWAAGGATDVDALTFACKRDHQLLGAGGWRTRKLADGRTEWIPPPQLPLSPRTNDYHHPERRLPDDLAS